MDFNNRKLMLFLFTILSIIACDNLEKPTNDSNNFYKTTRKGDLYRIPLIEPYELLSTGKSGHGWFLKIPPNTIPFEKQLFVDEVAVSDRIVFTKTHQMDIVNRGNTSIWCVIDKGFNVFYNEEDYQLYLKEININPTKLKNPDNFFELK